MGSELATFETSGETTSPEVEPGFVPTHTIAGTLVIKTARPLTAKGTRDPRPLYLDAEGNEVHFGTGRPAIKIEVPEPEPEEAPPPTAVLTAEAVAAVYRACAWPSWQEPCGYCETSGGHCARLDGYTDEAKQEALVRVCMRTPLGGEWHTVIVPKEGMFAVTGED